MTQQRGKRKISLLEILLACIALIALAIALKILMPNAHSVVLDYQTKVRLASLQNTEISQDIKIEEPIDTVFEIPDNLKDLYQTNPDFIGWLDDGADLDYPVTLRDNDYYLDHNFFGEKDANGTLFLNADNHLQPKDDVLFIHGHAMNSGAMFGNLTKYEKREYALAHATLHFQTIYDPTPVTYVPVAAFHASMDPKNKDYFSLLHASFPTNEDGSRPEYQAYLDEIMKRDILKLSQTVTGNDQLLVLVTCSYHQEDGRFMLFCRKR